LHTAVHLLATLWWLWVLVGLVFAGRVVKFLWLQRRLGRAGIYDIDRMDGTMFERRLGVLFRALGSLLWFTRRTQLTHPRGLG